MGVNSHKDLGIPHDNPFSPILANIFLNEFDHFIEVLKQNINDKKANIVSNTWAKFTKVYDTELINAKTKKEKKDLKKRLRYRKVKEAAKAGIEKIPQTKKDSTHLMNHRLFYVRYTDNYIIAIKGPKCLARDIKKRTENFLRFNLNFQLKSENLIHCGDNSARFLGFDLKIPEKKDRNVIETRKILSFKKMRNRLISRRNVMKLRFEKYILKSYESKKIKFLKTLMKNQEVKKYEAIRILALNDAYELKNLVELKEIKWSHGKELFSTWMEREYNDL